MATTPTPTPELQNASMDLASGFGSAGSLTGVIGAVAIVAITALILAYALSSLERYERLWWAASRLKRLFWLAGLGLGGVVALAVVSAPAYVVASQPAATRTEWLTYVGYGLAAFLALAAFGWVVERVIERALKRHAEYADSEPAAEPAADGGD